MGSLGAEESIGSARGLVSVLELVFLGLSCL